MCITLHGIVSKSLSLISLREHGSDSKGDFSGEPTATKLNATQRIRREAPKERLPRTSSVLWRKGKQN